MVQWNAEKLDILSEKIGTGFIWALVLGLDPWFRASRLDLRSGENTVECALSPRPGERRLILIPGYFRVEHGVKDVQSSYNVLRSCAIPEFSPSS